MKVSLKDGAPRSVGTVEINVSKNGNTVEIGATGVEPAPIVLELYDGKLTLRVYGEDGQPNVVQQVRTVPHPHDKTVAKPLAERVGATPDSAVAKFVDAVETAVAAPASEFDEAAFDAA